MHQHDNIEHMQVCEKHFCLKIRTRIVGRKNRLFCTVLRKRKKVSLFVNGSSFPQWFILQTSIAKQNGSFPFGPVHQHNNTCYVINLQGCTEIISDLVLHSTELIKLIVQNLTQDREVAISVLRTSFSG